MVSHDRRARLIKRSSGKTGLIVESWATWRWLLERTHDDVRQKSFEEVSNLLARCGKAGD
jgi:hypothetical protein